MIVLIFVPYILHIIAATIFNGLGYILNQSSFALTGAIIYIVAAISLPEFFFLQLLSAVFSFIGFFMLRKTERLPHIEIE